MDIKDYELVENQGVHVYKHVRSGFMVVEKIVPIKKGIEEINIMKALNTMKSNRFPQLIDYKLDENHMKIMMSKINGVTFNQVVQMPDLLDKIIRNLDVFKFNCLECLKALHNEGIVHRDVKPDNLIVDWSLNVYIIDFGSACFETSEELNCTLVGTYGYMSPEMLFSGPSIHFATDYYGLGKSLLFLLKSHKHLLSAKQYEEILELCEIQIEKRKKNIERF